LKGWGLWFFAKIPNVAEKSILILVEEKKKSRVGRKKISERNKKP
jgi:hypothetical protein